MARKKNEPTPNAKSPLDGYRGIALPVEATPIQDVAVSAQIDRASSLRISVMQAAGAVVLDATNDPIPELKPVAPLTRAERAMDKGEEKPTPLPKRNPVVMVLKNASASVRGQRVRLIGGTVLEPEWSTPDIIATLQDQGVELRITNAR